MNSPASRRFDWRHLLAGVLAALAAGAGLGVVIDDDGHGHRTITVSVGKRDAIAVPTTIAVDGPDKDAKADDTVKLSPEARATAAGFAIAPRDLTADTPTAVPLSGSGDLGPIAKLAPPFAADEVAGCRTRFLRNNWSYRVAGAKVSLLWLHYTAGPDKPNTRAEVDGLSAYGNNPSTRASWHINLDKDGNCDYNVPFRYKAWTEGNANSTGIGVEVHGTGTAPYLRPAGYRRLARIYLAVKRAYGIPLRLGAVSSCTPTRSGIVTHWMGGACSGGHYDIKPLAIEAIIRELRKYVAEAECSSRCQRAKALRAKHRRTHERFVKNRCNRPKGIVRHGYCDTLRARNKAVHAAARRERISLKG